MSLNWIQTLVLALLQGITELFPISSLGHTVIIPGLLGWTTLVQSPQFLPLIVAFHLGTSIVLVLFFWRDWWVLIRTLVQSVKQGEVKQGEASWVSWLVIIGCIPAGLLGVFLEKPLKHLFASPLIAAALLVVNGSILLLGEALRHRARVSTQKGQERGRFPHPWNQLGLPADRHAELGLPSHSWVGESAAVAISPSMQGPTGPRELSFRPLTSLSWKDAILIGLAQSLALLPGISRSGVTMVAGIGMGLSHEEAAHYAFLLGTPLIAAAALLEVPNLAGASGANIILVVIGMALSGVAAYLSTRFLMRYVETGRLHPFAYYCWGVGGLSLLLFLLGVGSH